MAAGLFEAGGCKCKGTPVSSAPGTRQLSVWLHLVRAVGKTTEERKGIRVYMQGKAADDKTQHLCRWKEACP